MIMVMPSNPGILRRIIFLLIVTVLCSITYGKVIYVDDDVSTSGSGSSWMDAVKYLQDALADASSGDEICVAQGIYKPDQGSNHTPGDQKASFQLISGVVIEGGYAGVGAVDPNERDIELYKTELSGDLLGNDDPESGQSDYDNSFHVVNSSGTNPTAVLDGIYITAGYGPDGGGMYNIGGSPTVTHCNFFKNAAFVCGGGMYNEGGNPSIIHSTFIENSSGEVGGGMYNDNGNPKLKDCVFHDNSILISPPYPRYSRFLLGGGGLYNHGGMPHLDNCTFSDNNVTYHFSWDPSIIMPTCSGAGIYNAGGKPYLIKCIFIDNKVIVRNTHQSAMPDMNKLPVWGGGGIFNSSYLDLVDCIFNNNSLSADLKVGDGKGGGIFNRYGASSTLINCIFNGNSAQSGNALASYSSGPRSATVAVLNNCILWDGGNEIWKDGDSLITITYSNIRGGVEGEGNIDTDPLFADAINGDYHLKSEAGRWDPVSEDWIIDNITSPCIDAGDPNSPIGYEPIPNGGRINMGAYGGTPQASMSQIDVNSISIIHQASDPIPGDKAVDAGIDTVLSWTADVNAVWNEVYFGTDRFPPFVLKQIETEYDPGYLIGDTTYYWRIDQTDEKGNRSMGKIWTFVTASPPAKAYNPIPINESNYVDTKTLLSWDAGLDAVSHNVYFGTTNPPPFIQNQTETEFDPYAVKSGTKYYWRIDEVDNQGTIVTGDVWSFVTVPPPKGRACFISNTLVLIDGILIPISKVGFDRRADCIDRISEIEEVQEHQGTFTCYDVILDSGNCISVADNHYFMVESGQWLSLHGLRAGTRLKTAKGSVEIVKIIKRPKHYTGKVYNIKVAGSDQYLVGKDGVIVRDH